jgi:hypothetical protein
MTTSWSWTFLTLPVAFTVDRVRAGCNFEGLPRPFALLLLVVAVVVVTVMLVDLGLDRWLDGSTDSSLDSSFIAGTNGIGERLSEYRFTEEKRREGRWYERGDAGYWDRQTWAETQITPSWITDHSYRVECKILFNSHPYWGLDSKPALHRMPENGECLILLSLLSAQIAHSITTALNRGKNWNSVKLTGLSDFSPLPFGGVRLPRSLALVLAPAHLPAEAAGRGEGKGRSLKNNKWPDRVEGFSTSFSITQSHKYCTRWGRRKVSNMTNVMMPGQVTDPLELDYNQIFKHFNGLLSSNIRRAGEGRD